MWVWLNYVSGACYLQSSLVKVWYVMCLWQNFDILLLWWMWMFVSWAWVAHRSWSFALNSTLNGINKEDYLKIHQSTYFLRKCLYIKKNKSDFNISTIFIIRVCDLPLRTKRNHLMNRVGWISSIWWSRVGQNTKMSQKLKQCQQFAYLHTDFIWSVTCPYKAFRRYYM